MLKKFFTSGIGVIVINLLIALVVGLVLIACTLGWLGKYTRHGEEVQVPDIKGLFVEEAAMIVQQEGMTIQVIDSTYNRKLPLGTIVDQNPQAESMAKRDRVLYVVVNARQLRQVPLPDLRDVSYRQAEASLKGIGLEVEDVVYEPSVYKDLVLDVRKGEMSIEPGTRLNEGTKVVLVVGFGAGTEMVRVPDLTGKSKEAARAALLSSRLIIGSVSYDEELTEENVQNFVVYEQSLHSGVEILEGSRVDIKMTTSLEKAASAAIADDEEDFF